MPNSTRAAGSRSGARCRSREPSGNWRSRLIPVVMASAILLLTASCRLPADLRALSRSTTALTETLREEIPPTTTAIRATAVAMGKACVAMEGDALERKEQTQEIGDKLNQALGWIVSGLIVLVVLLRGFVAKRLKKLVGAGGPSSSQPGSS